MEKLKGEPLGITDATIRSIYAGLAKVFTMLQDAYKQVQAGTKPDFINELPFPDPLPALPANPTEFPSWFMIAWKTVENTLNALATRNSKIAEFLPPVEAAGDELVKDLEKYFPSKTDSFTSAAAVLDFSGVDKFPELSDTQKLTPEQQQDWEKKLMQYAYIVTITCDVLMGIDKIVMEKLTGKPLGIVDSTIRAVYAGLSKVYTMLQDGYKQAQAGQKPDFTNELPFPDQPSPLPANAKDFPSWFMVAWNTVKNALNLLAARNPKTAEFLPPIEAAGDELVKDLQQYFPSQDIYAMKAFPEIPGPI
ncbi:uncharacterized protein [Dysidea avara]